MRLKKLCHKIRHVFSSLDEEETILSGRRNTACCLEEFYKRDEEKWKFKENYENICELLL